MAFHCTFQKLECGSAIAPLAGKDLQDLAFVIHGAPQIVRLAADPDKHFIEMPSPLGMVSLPLNASLADLRGEHGTKPVPPEPYRFVADIDAALMEQVLDLTQR